MSRAQRINRLERATRKSGWLFVFTGASRRRSMDRAIARLNDDGYRVTFVVEDKTSLLWPLLQAAVAMLTLLAYWPNADQIIVGELADSGQASPEEGESRKHS